MPTCVVLEKMNPSQGVQRKLKMSSHYMSKSQALRNETLLPLMLTFCKIVTPENWLALRVSGFHPAMQRNRKVFKGKNIVF